MPLLRTYDPSQRKIVSSLKSGFVDRLSRWSDIQEYLPFLHDTARSYPQVRVLELGSRQGNSTLAFLAAADEAGGHVWSCDIDPVDSDPAGMLPWRSVSRWTFTCGDDMDPAVQAKLPAEVDVFFLDTSHEYEHTLAELRAYMPRVAPGGIALFHDTNIIGWPGYHWDRDIPPVRAALDDWCAEAGLTWENTPGEYGMGVIRVDLRRLRARQDEGHGFRPAGAVSPVRGQAAAMPGRAGDAGVAGRVRGRNPGLTGSRGRARAVRCPGCGHYRPDEIPYEPVRVVEVTSRDADGIPDGFREYFAGTPETGRPARARRARLGRPAAPRGVPEGVA